MITGFYKKEGAAVRPFVSARIIFQDIGEKCIEFLIDTGADFTIISGEDVLRIGLDHEKLEKAEKNVGGIGGKVETYITEVVLKIEPDFVKRIKTFVMRNKIPEYLPDKDKKRLKVLYRRIPSLLGIDIIREFGFFIHERTERIYLLKDDEIPDELFEITKNQT